MADLVIPEGPWTIERLGEKKYFELAIAFGVTDGSKNFTPALDLTEPYNEQQKVKQPDDVEAVEK